MTTDADERQQDKNVTKFASVFICFCSIHLFTWIPSDATSVVACLRRSNTS